MTHCMHFEGGQYPQFISDAHREIISKSTKQIEDVLSVLHVDYEEFIGLRTAVMQIRQMLELKERWIKNGGSW